MSSHPDWPQKPAGQAVSAPCLDHGQWWGGWVASLIWAVLLIGFHPLLWNGLLRPGNEPPGYRWLYGLLAIMGLIWGLSSRRSPSRALAVLAAVMLLSVLLVPSIVR